MWSGECKYSTVTPQSKLDIFNSTFSPDSKQSFLHKHGNGRVIRGIGEGLHTMKVGGKSSSPLCVMCCPVLCCASFYAIARHYLTLLLLFVI